jgi:hypothetical protein
MSGRSKGIDNYDDELRKLSSSSLNWNQEGSDFYDYFKQFMNDRRESFRLDFVRWAFILELLIMNYDRTII